MRNDAAADAPSSSDASSMDSGDSGTCPTVKCPSGQFCMVVGAKPDATPSGNCQAIPCMAASVCMCNIIFCGGGGIQGCADNTIYCP